jgi:HK97 family phage major capsid protein
MSKAKHIPQAIRAALNKDQGRAVREISFERATVNADARTVEICFATETPYERYWGVEILDCAPSSVRTQRLKSGCNLIMDHDARDVVAVVESHSFGADRKVRAVVRFGKSARAQEIFADVADGIRTNVSVGYLIHKAVLESEADGVGTYRVTDWEPYELTLTAVPADINAGVGRSAALPDAEQKRITVQVTVCETEDDEEDAAEPMDGEADEAPESEDTATAEASIPTPIESEKTMTDVTTVATRNHAAEISAMGAQMGLQDLALKSIQAGHSTEQFQGEALRELAKKPVPTSDIGMSQKEVRQFNILSGINALANPNNAQARAAAAFEFECSQEVAKKMGRAAGGFYLPSDVQRRDLTAGTANAGGYSVATELRGFIDILRNAMVIDRAGAVFLSGLQGNIAIPKLSAAGTAYWVAENGAPTESQQTMAQVTMSPKTVGAFTDISRQLILQSSLDVQNMVTRDLATIIGLGIQQAAINGAGASNEPTGILTAVTASQIGGTDGLAPTWAHIVGLESDIAASNADVGTMGYLTNAKVRGKLKVTQKFASTNGMPVWTDGNTPLNGYAAYVTNAVPSNLTKGNQSLSSAIIFGNFADLLIGLWGATDILVDPYTGGAAGTVRVRVLQSCDVALRHVESFATMEDAITA